MLGEPMPAARRTVLPLIGALVEGPGAYPHLSGAANLALLDATGPNPLRGGHRRAQIGAVLEQVGLDPADRRPTRAYSLGMRQRLGLAAALMRRPRLLILDEPTNGLDPQGITEIRRLLLELNAGGTTIFLSSHLLAEIEQMCTRVGVLDRGRLVLQERAGRAAAADRPGRGPYAGRVPLRLAARRRRGQRRGSAAAGQRRRPGGAERLPGRAGRPGGRGRAVPARPGAGRARARWEHSDDPGRAGQAAAPAADLGDHRHAGRAAHPGRHPAGDHRPRAAAGHRPAVPVGGAQRRHAVPAGRAGRGAAAVPAHRGRGAGRRRDRR